MPSTLQFAAGASWSPLELPEEDGLVGQARPHLTPLSPGLVFRCLRFVSVTQAAKASLGGCGATAGRAAPWGAGQERDAGSSQGCWAVQSWTPHWEVQGSSGDKLGEDKLFKGCYFQTGLMGD